MRSDQTLKNKVAEFDNSTGYRAILLVYLQYGAVSIMGYTIMGIVVATILREFLRTGLGMDIWGQVVAFGIVIFIVCSLALKFNDSAIMTVHDNGLSFYVLDKFSFKIIIRKKIDLSYEEINKLKISKSIVLNNIKINYTNSNNSNNQKVKIQFSDTPLGLKEQKVNAEILLGRLKSLNV